jgi:hypothetical protein
MVHFSSLSGAHRNKDAPDDEPALRHDRVAERPEFGGSVRHLHVSSDGARRFPRVLLGAATGGEGVSSHVEGKPMSVATQAGLRRPAVAPGIAASLRLDRTSLPFAPVGPRSSRLCGVGHATISFRFEIPGGPPPLRGFARARISAICSGVFAPTAS